MSAPDRKSVVCIGDLMVDVVTALDEPLNPGSDAPARIAIRGGGSAANTACWLAHIDVPATFVGQVGDDELGRSAVAELSSLGVNTLVGIDQLRPTGTCVVIVGPDGERTMAPDTGANSGLRVSELPTDDIDHGGWLHVSGYTLLNVAAQPAAVSAMARATAAGIPCSVDASSAAPLAAMGAAAFLGLVPTGSYILANADEALVLTGESDPATAAAALSAAGYHAVVKAGALGAFWHAAGSSDTAHVEAAPAAPIDSTGAGDAFAAGLIASLLGANLPTEAMERGAVLAAEAVGTVGARPAAG